MLRPLLLVLLASSAVFAEAGDSFNALAGLMSSQVTALVFLLGGICALWQFTLGRRIVAVYIIAGMLFLAGAKVMVTAWFNPGNPGGPAGFAIGMGEFPYYGQDPATRIGGDDSAYASVQTWCYIGLAFCHAALVMATTHALPLIVALAGTLVVYWKITVKQEAGSIINYFLWMFAVGAFVWFPTTTFTPIATPNENSLLTAMNSVSGADLNTKTSSAGSLSIPMLPAMVFVHGNDLATAIGKALSPSPESSYSRRVQESSQAAVPPDGWAKVYEQFARACGAASQAFIDSETNNRTDRVSGLSYNLKAFDTTVVPKLQLARDLKAGGAVFSSSLNALSPWGDLMHLNVPLDAYLVDDPAQDLPQIAENKVLFDKSKSFWRGDVAKGRTLSASGNAFSNPRLTTVGSEDWSQVNRVSLPTFNTVDGVASVPQSLWTYPIIKGSSSALQKLLTDSRTDSTATFGLRFCAVPRGGDGTLRYPTSSSGNRFFSINVEKNSPSNPEQDLGSVGSPAINSFYVSQFWNQATFNNAARSGLIQIAPYDLSLHVRQALLSFYTSEVCRPACGNPGHRNHFGCLVTGKFIKLYNNGAGDTYCKADSDATKFFYGLPVSTPTAGPQYYQWALDAISSGVPAGDRWVTRDSAALLANATNPASPDVSAWSYGSKTAAVDLIMASPGFANAIGAGSSGLSGAPSDGSVGGDDSVEMGFSKLWDLMSGKGTAEFLINLFIIIAVWCIKYFYGHLMGITDMLLLLLYPVFALVAIWPGRWRILIDWCLGAFWVILWPVPIALGIAFINGGGTVMERALTLTSSSGPNSIILSIIGICLVLMAPIIAQAIITPSFATIGKLGTTVYGTGFKLLGAAATLAAAAVGLGAVALGASMGAKSGADTPDAGTIPSSRTGGGGRGEGDRSDGGGPDSPAQERSQIIAGASRGARMGRDLGKGLSQAVYTGAQAMDLLGAPGVSSGAGVGDAVGDLGYRAASEAGAGGVAVARAAGREYANQALARGEDPQASRLGRAALDISRSTGRDLEGSALGRFMSSNPISGSADTSAQVTSLRASAAVQARDAVRAERDGNVDQAKTSYEALAATNSSLVRASRLEGDFEGAAIYAKESATAKASAARLGGTPDWQSVHTAHQQSLRSAEDVERRAGILKDAPMAARAKEMQGGIRLASAEALFSWAGQLEGQADVLEQKLQDNPEDIGLKREVQQTRHQAQDLRRQGTQEASFGLGIFAGAGARHAEFLQAASAGSRDSGDLASLQAVRTHSTALTSMMAQAEGVNDLAGGEIDIPVSIQRPRVRAVLQSSGKSAGPVAAQIITGVDEAASGDFVQAATSFREAVRMSQGSVPTQMVSELNQVAEAAEDGTMAAMAPASRASLIAGNGGRAGGVHRGAQSGDVREVVAGEARKTQEVLNA